MKGVTGAGGVDAFDFVGRLPVKAAALISGTAFYAFGDYLS